jgi:hypothetical protein
MLDMERVLSGVKRSRLVTWGAHSIRRPPAALTLATQTTAVCAIDTAPALRPMAMLSHTLDAPWSGGLCRGARCSSHYACLAATIPKQQPLPANTPRQARSCSGTTHHGRLVRNRLVRNSLVGNRFASVEGDLLLARRPCLPTLNSTISPATPPDSHPTATKRGRPRQAAPNTVSIHSPPTSQWSLALCVTAAQRVWVTLVASV